MTVEILYKKLKFYRYWYESMTRQERLATYIGAWVMERIIIYSTIIKDMDKAVAMFQRSPGNYPFTYPPPPST